MSTLLLFAYLASLWACTVDAEVPTTAATSEDKQREKEGKIVQLARKEVLDGAFYEQSDLKEREEARSWQKVWKISISPLFIKIAFPGIALAVTAYLFSTWHSSRALQSRPLSTSRSRVALAWFVLCFALLVGVDILIKTNGSNKQQTSLVLTVLLAEACKLLFSLVSLAVSASRVKPGRFDAQGAIAKGDIIRLGLDLLPVTLAYSMNNVLSFYVLSVMRFDAAVVWRNCSILFTAMFWTGLLNRPLGFNRKLAVVLCLAGCFMNSFASDGALEVDGATPFVLLQAASTAAGSVLNEKVIKSERAKHVSLDLVNSLLYSEMTVVLCCCCFAQHLAFGTALSFATFTRMTWIVVIVYASVGLAVSRVLKYGDSVSYSIMSGLRSPAGILLAPVFVSGSHVSIGAVTSGAMVFLAVIFNATPDHTGETKPLVAHKQ